MDFSKFKTSDWLKVGGAAVVLIFGFLPWSKYEFPGGDLSWNAWDFFFTGILPWILIVGSGVIALLLATNKMKAGSAPWPLVLLAAVGLGTLLILIRLIFNLDPEDTNGADVEFDRGIGLIISAIGAVAAFVGAVLGFKESGGDFNDLKDINKIKGQFGGGDTPPPPPPSGMAPPPPPPSS